MKTVWSAEEDRDLTAAVVSFGEGYGSWPLVASAMEGRTASQCRERWRNALQPGLRRGRWTAMEERLLYLAVRAHSKDRWIEARSALLSEIPALDARLVVNIENVLDSHVCVSHSSFCCSLPSLNGRSAGRRSPSTCPVETMSNAARNG